MKALVEKVEESNDNQETDIEESKEKDQIDEILDGSTSYSHAVDQGRLFKTNLSSQAEPSHFHLAAVENERKNPTLTAANA